MVTRQRLYAAALLLTAIVAGGCGDTPTAPSARSAATTTLSITSDPIALIGQARTYTLQNATFRALSLRRGGAIDVTVRPTDQSSPWIMLLSSPSGSGLTTGTFVTDPFNGDNQWRFSFFGFDERCGGGPASVTVHEVAITETLVHRFRATFAVRCDDMPGTLRGEVVVLADPWR